MPNPLEELKDPNLEALTLNHTEFNETLMQAIENHPRLHTLKITNKKPDDSYLKRIAKLPRLKHLTLQRLFLKNLDFLQGNKTLESLDLSRNDLRPDCLGALKNMRFYELVLDENPIITTQTPIANRPHALTAFHNHPTLRDLSLKNTGVYSDILNELLANSRLITLTANGLDYEQKKVTGTELEKFLNALKIENCSLERLNITGPGYSSLEARPSKEQEKELKKNKMTTDFLNQLKDGNFLTIKALKKDIKVLEASNIDIQNMRDHLTGDNVLHRAIHGQNSDIIFYITRYYPSLESCKNRDNRPPDLKKFKPPPTPKTLPAAAAASPQKEASEYPQITVKNRIGFGSFGEVHKGSFQKTANDPEIDVAIKYCDEHESYKNEVFFLSQLNHWNIIRLFHYAPSKLVLELMWGDLFTFIGKIANGEIKEKIPPNNFLKLMLGVAEALKYLHDLNILHRDIKPENILLDNENPTLAKLTDFGLAKKNGEAPKEPCYSEGYAAPELIDKQDEKTFITAATKPSDVYAAGITMEKAKEMVENPTTLTSATTLFQQMRATSSDGRPNIGKVCETLISLTT